MSEFLAEAQVLVTPNTATFAALLRTELAAEIAKLGPVTIPVVAAPAGGASAAAAQAVATTQSAAATQKAAAATVKKTAADRAAEVGARQLTLAERAIAAGERQVLATTTEVAAARVRLNAANRALTRTELGYTEILASQNPVLIANASEQATLAAEYQASAIAAFEAAVATDALSVAQGKEVTSANAAAAAEARRTAGIAKGAAATGLAGLGARGATLAAGAPFLAGAAAAVALGKSLQLATSFTSEIAVLGATTGATATEMSRAADAAKDFGRDISLPGVTAGDAAKTITEFSKAGLTLNDSIAATRGGLQLAQAAQIEYADAVQLTANALNVFNLEGSEAVHVADTLANSANLSQGSIADVGVAFSQSAAAAKVVGVSFEDTIALLTLLARNGLTSSDAGTALRTSFIRLVNPSKEAQAILQKLNINLRDIQGNVRPEVFREFADAQRDLSVAQQQANAAVVFGQDAFRVIGILGAEAPGALDEVRGGLDKTGTAAELARARMVGLAGATENLSNQLSSLGLSLGQSLTPFVTGLVRGLGAAAGGINFLVDAIKDLGGAQFDIDTAALEDMRDRLEEINKEADHFRESGGFVPPRLTNETDEIVTKIQAMGAAILASSGSVPAFAKFFSDASPQIAKALRDGVITPAEEVEIAVTRMGEAFLAIAPDKMFAAGTSTLEREAKKLADAMGKAGSDVAGAFFSFFEITARRAGKQVGPTLKEFTVDVASKLALDLAVARASGDEGAELSVLREREARQQKFLDAVLGRKQTKKNLAFAQEAAENLGRTRSEITAIVEGNAADAKEARDKQTKIKEGQDKAFLEAQQDARSRQERLITLAGDTEGVADDIRRQQGLRTLITKQIAALKASGVDEKTKTAALKTLNTAKQATTDEINRLQVTEQEERDAERQRGLDAQVALAEATGNVALQKRLIQVQINAINEQIKAENLKGAALNEAKTKRATLQQQQEDLQNQGIQSQIALGQSILDLTGNKNPILKALAAAVAETRKDILAAQRAGKSTVDLQTELNNFLAQRKNVLEDAKKEAKGTTAFDLLTQASQTFAATGGNLIGGDQPFAGPTGFTADIAQFLRRQRGATTGAKITTDITAGAGIERQTAATVSLTTSIDQLKESIDRSSGNTAVGAVTVPSGGVVGGFGHRGMSLAKFWEARGAREGVEG